MTDEYGEAMIGVSVASSDNTAVTVSNPDGDFSLNLSAGKKHILRISYIGYKTAEISVEQSEYWEVLFYDDSFKITRTLNNPDGGNLTGIVLSYKLRNEQNGEGVLYMTDDIPAGYSSESLTGISDIKPIGNGFVIKETKGKYSKTGMEVNYTTFIDISKIGKLPRTQNSYSQGRNDLHFVTNEKFSRGPEVSELSNNVTALEVYKPEDFFRSGISFGNALDIKVPGLSHGAVNISLGQKKDNSPIPEAYKESYNTSLVMKEVKTGYLKNEIGVYYNSSYGKLTGQGSNMETLLYSVLTTPPTYNNQTGLSRKNPMAWQLPDGSKRSNDPSFVDNPYELISNLPDKERNEYLMSYVKSLYEIQNIKWANSFSFDKRRSRFVNGNISDYQEQRLTKREDLISNITMNSDFTWKLKGYDPELKLTAGYGFKHIQDKVEQSDFFPVLSSNVDVYNRKLIRNSHDIRYGFVLGNQNLNIETAFKHYFSNTARSSHYTNFFPEIGINLRLNEILDGLFDSYYHDLSLYGNIKRSIGEVSLIDRNPAALSTIMEAKDFRNYYEYRLPVYKDGLKPEIYLKTEIGLRFWSEGGKFSAELNGYMYNTHNLTSVVFENNSPELKNIGRIRSCGYNLELGYRSGIFGNRNWLLDVKYSFSRFKSKVTALYEDSPYIRLAGFADVATVFAENQPLGVIYGSRFLRNNEGNVIIGQDGFPLVDNNIGKIGDPTPDFFMTLKPAITFKSFVLSFLLEYQQGGDRWNGTRSVMDYRGISEYSGEKRNIKQFVFNGVTESGATNAKAAGFYNPSSDISDNRWVRYGMTGVGEEYIEKTTFLRLSDVTLKYSPNTRRFGFFRNLTIGVSAKNLLLVSSYKGTDPSTLLFGYSSAKGLDLFNLPSLRSYSFVITLGF